VFGFARDLVIARVFGADEATDAFVIAYKVPNFFRRLFSEGAFATAFVPVLAEYRTRRSAGDLRGFVDHVAGTLGLGLLVISLAGVVLAPLLVLLFAPGWAAGGAGQADLAARMLELTFPYLLFVSLTAFAGGILNVHGRFGVPAFTPVLLNLALIACALWLSPQLETPIMALAWGVLIGGIAQFAFQLPFLHRLGLVPRFRPSLRDEGVRRVLGFMVPAFLGVSVTQVNLLLDTLMASFLTGGSITWLYYSGRLMDFPVGILGAALATVILPHLSRMAAQTRPQEFSRALDWGLRWTLLFGLPAAVGLVMLAGPVMATLFQSEAFSVTDVGMSGASLSAYALGIAPLMLAKVLAPGYYARQDVRTPLRIAVATMALNLVLNLVFMGPLQHVGLALATSIAASANGVLLLWGLRRRGIYAPPAGWVSLVLKGAAASASMLLVLWWGGGELVAWTDATAGWRILHLGALIAGGALVYFAVLLICGVRPRDFKGLGPAAAG
jgi:putative peptidoglycan lipid II flippase